MNFPYVNFKIESVLLKNHNPTIATESKSLIRLVRKIPAQRWEINIRTVRLNESDYRVCQAFIDGLEGRYGTFQLILPRYSQPLGLALGSPVTSGNTTAGFKTLNVAGFAGAGIQVKVGDFFKFNNHSKVYRAVANCTTAANGTGVLKFIPNLIRDVPTGSSIQLRDVPFTLRQKNDVNDYSSSAKIARKQTLDLDLEEVL